MWHYLPGFASQAKKSGKFSPEENDDYVRRNSVPSRARGMTVSDFSPAEWKMVKEQGFSLDDILLIRNRGKK